MPDVPATPRETPHEFDFSLEEYIAGLKWSDQATDHEKTLVVGNLRGMFAVIREKHNAFVLAARTLGVGFDQYDNLFKALVRDGIIEFKNDKVRILSVPSERGEKDAERYRWLVMNMRVARASTDGARHYIDVPPAKSMDEAIDLAMKKSQYVAEKK